MEVGVFARCPRILRSARTWCHSEGVGTLMTDELAAAAAARGSDVVPSEVDGWRLCCNPLQSPFWKRASLVRLVISIHGLKCNAHAG